MDGNNSNNQNKPNQGSNNQKPGLSWTQPNASAVQNKTTPKTTPAAQSDSTGRVMGIIVGIVVVFALAAWGIVALQKRSAANDLTAATSTNMVASSSTSSDTNDTVTPVATPVTPTSSPTPTPTPVTPTQTSPVGSATVSVPSPQDAGSSVSFTNLSISEPTWVIVYETTDGAPGRILGAGLFFKGDTSGTVSLLRATTAGSNYLVSTAVDNGDKSFVKADEKYVLGSDGSQMWVKFQTR